MWYLRAASLFAAGLAAGCTFHLGSVVLGDTPDLGLADDLGSQPSDATSPPADQAPEMSVDLAPPTDQSVPNDMAPSPDLAMSLDLGPSPDLRAPFDMAPPPDLAPGSGSLQVTHVPASGDVDLTALGTVDWMHFGLNVVTDVNRKSGTPRLGAAATGMATRLASYPASFSWSNGTPTASASKTNGGIMVQKTNEFFQVEAPAKRTVRQLDLYVGQFQTAATLQAQLSDNSAGPAIDVEALPKMGGAAWHYTIRYAAANNNASLRVTWTLNSATADPPTGGIVLQAAALSE